MPQASQRRVENQKGYVTKGQNSGRHHASCTEITQEDEVNATFVDHSQANPHRIKGDS